MAIHLGRIQLLAKPANDWAINDAVLLRGQIGAADIDTMAPLVKMGDGVRPWSQLPNMMAPVTAANDYVAGTVTTSPPGSSATVNIDNTVDPPTISFGIPKGAKGDPNVLTIGTVVASAPGGPAAASITGTSPAQVLNLVIPRGEQGPQGVQGVPGPPNVLTIGTVTTGAAGSAAAASITGTSPAQVLSLTIPTGAQGPQGVQGEPGPPGVASGSVADNTGTIGLTRIQGSALTSMRSDAAPPLSQAIAPTWTGPHTFTKNRTAVFEHGLTIQAANASLGFQETDAAEDKKRWSLAADTGVFTLYAFNDAETVATPVIQVARTGTTIDSIALNATSVGTSSTFVCGANMVAVGGIIALRNWRYALTDLNDGYLRLNSDSHYASGIYTPLNFWSNARVQASTGLANASDALRIHWGPPPGVIYGTCYVTGASGAYHGIGVEDGVTRPVFMANGVNAGIYLQPDAKWLITRLTPTTANTDYHMAAPSFTAPSFNVSSSRKLKRETGKPTRAADILSRLRPILYRLLADDAHEQLGMIAEDVHDICPWLSRDGKTIAYDRVAMLLLAEWQDTRGIS